MFYDDSDIKVLKKLKNQTILITGATGFIGYYLMQLLLDFKSKEKIHFSIYVACRDINKAKNLFYNKDEFQELKYIEYNFETPLEEKIKEEVNYIVHLAAPARSDVFLSKPASSFNTIVQGTSRILNFAHEKNTKMTVYCSSSTVYGNLCRESISEKMYGSIDFTDYHNVYAMGKMAAEQLCACYSKEHGVKIRVIRPSYIYGANTVNNDSSVWNYVLNKCATGNDISMQNSGYIHRSLCYVKDVARAIVYVLLEDTFDNIFNITSDDSSIREFAETAVSVCKKSKLIFTGQQNISNEKTYYSNKNLCELGWKSMFNLSSGINDSINTINMTGGIKYKLHKPSRKFSGGYYEAA